MWLALLLLVHPSEAARRARPAPPPPEPPKPDGWWDPARDPWSADALRVSFRQLEEKPAPSSFLGDTSGMTDQGGVEWAWFAEGFHPERYATVAVAPPRNGMGRFHQVGERLLRDAEVRELRKVTRGWRQADAGTDAELVVYTHLRWALTSEAGVAWVVENMGVDADKNIVFRTQALVGAAPPGAVAPDARTQFGWLADVAADASGELASALLAVAEAAPEAPPSADSASPDADAPTVAASPPVAGVRLHVERADLVSPRAEAFGPALTAQIAAAVRAAEDASVPLDERVARVTALGHLGAAAAVPLLCKILLDPELDPALRAAAVWAAGEVGHPNALPPLDKARGIDPYLIRTAITKIDQY